MSFVKRNSDYVFTFLVEFLVLIAGVLVYKFAANLEGANDFSEYAISRRTISFILPLLILGNGVGVPRYIAFAHNKKKTQDTYFLAGLITTFSFAIPLLFVFYFFRAKFSYLFFGNVSFDYLIPSLCIMILGLLLHGLNYGYFRGKVNMYLANAFQLLNFGIAPLIVFVFFDSVEEVIFYTGIFWLTISSIFTLYILITSKWDLQNLKSQIKELLVFGTQRVPGDFVLAAFLALPAYFAAHMVEDGLKTAGYVAFAMSFLNMAGAAFGPLSLILLPKASVIIKNKEFKLLKHQIKKITVWTLGLTLLGFIILEVFTNQIIHIYLGKESLELIYTIRVTFLASFGYTIYISLRSILDAYYVRAVNTINIIISFVIFIILQLTSSYFIPDNYINTIYCFVIGMLVLGILTYIETKKIIRKHETI